MSKVSPSALSRAWQDTPSEAQARVRPEHKHEVPALDERDVLLTRVEAAAYLRKSTATLDRWAVQGIGPQPVKLGPRTVGYPLLRLREFIGAV